jgi:cytochrome c-type biogenesis protein CcmF
LFVVYRGVNDEGAFSLDVRVNPLISFVWLGFGLLMLGVFLSTIGRRKSRHQLETQNE